MTIENKIEQWLQDVYDKDSEQGDIAAALRTIILETAPDCDEEIKYGGIVFNRNAVLITGIFLRKAHISLEFSFGATFEDSNKILEGNGKYRRHIKLRNVNEIESKNVSSFISIAFQ